MRQACKLQATCIHSIIVLVVQDTCHDQDLVDVVHGGNNGSKIWCACTQEEQGCILEALARRVEMS